MLVPYHGRIRQRGGYPVFEGRVYQRGRGFGSVLSGLFRNFIVPAAKNIGKDLLRTGLQKSSSVLQSVADGRSLRDAVSDHIATSPADFGQRLVRSGLQQTSDVLRNISKDQSGGAIGHRFTRNVRPAKCQNQRKRRMIQKTLPAKRVKKDIFD